MSKLRTKLVVSILIVSILAIGCSIPQALIATGESLKVVGNQFVSVAAAYKHGCDVAKTIPQSQCLKFREFGTYFQKVYPLTIQLWEAARLANDAALQGKASDVIQSLSVTLSNLAAEGLGTFSVGGM